MCALLMADGCSWVGPFITPNWLFIVLNKPIKQMYSRFAGSVTEIMSCLLEFLVIMVRVLFVFIMQISKEFLLYFFAVNFSQETPARGMGIRK